MTHYGPQDSGVTNARYTAATRPPRLIRTGDVTEIVIDAEARWDHSTFPHPLVTLDYSAEGRLIKIVATILADVPDP